MLIPVFLYLATGYPTELWITILPLSASLDNILSLYIVFLKSSKTGI
ncbi:hypothetical protein SeD_A2323 [Salmonella enterica subsp. enterica serovar Dublin str. CT_02021853]|uniref:Uncharacterized protein n=2 Tax=Salmonella dublin TaxID=98360 RepID=A0A8X6ETZ0_SALDU|nr:hypothetical protein SeD_A2323 [Salmonella enterica subsp. enterica serovar Dublin str. CT_02021853]EGE30168.1 hypothetical protein SD3246_2254 [Salmonella enterica subsp. enterica serovar Dublin str. SD3246]